MAPQCRKKAADGVRYAAGPQAAFAKCKGKEAKKVKCHSVEPELKICTLFSLALNP